jgi:hypothetical protein
MLWIFIGWLFGCSHRRTTFPLTPSRKKGFTQSNKGTYIVCLDCGKEFGYNWADMKITREISVHEGMKQMGIIE